MYSKNLNFINKLDYPLDSIKFKNLMRKHNLNSSKEHKYKKNP